jgi:hypothetical protein
MRYRCVFCNRRLFGLRVIALLGRALPVCATCDGVGPGSRFVPDQIEARLEGAAFRLNGGKARVRWRESMIQSPRTAAAIEIAIQAALKAGQRDVAERLRLIARKLERTADSDSVTTK